MKKTNIFKTLLGIVLSLSLTLLLATSMNVNAEVLIEHYTGTDEDGYAYDTYTYKLVQGDVVIFDLPELTQGMTLGGYNTGMSDDYFKSSWASESSNNGYFVASNGTKVDFSLYTIWGKGIVPEYSVNDISFFQAFDNLEDAKTAIYNNTWLRGDDSNVPYSESYYDNPYVAEAGRTYYVPITIKVYDTIVYTDTSCSGGWYYLSDGITYSCNNGNIVYLESITEDTYFTYGVLAITCTGSMPTPTEKITYILSGDSDVQTVTSYDEAVSFIKTGNYNIVTVYDNGSITDKSNELQTELQALADEYYDTTPQSVYRLYNPNSGEHFFTMNASERDYLDSIGWNYEAVAWLAPKSGELTHRLYNPNSGEHFYTTSSTEYMYLCGIGWNYEGKAWYSDTEQTTPVYRVYNPNATGIYEVGSHHYTTDISERDSLVAQGWNSEGNGWYGA